MPIVVDTLAAKARRRRIEGTLDELEKALDTFSRPVVFVPDAPQGEEEQENGPESSPGRRKEKTRQWKY
jgi:hypothetical protein